MDTDNYAQPLEAVMREERQRVYSMPLKVADRRYLFKEWCEKNPKALREIELTALAIDARGLRVSTKYLIEKQRYEGHREARWSALRGRSGQRTHLRNQQQRQLFARAMAARAASGNAHRA